MSPFAVLISGLLRSVPSHRTDWIRPGSATDQVWSAMSADTRSRFTVEELAEITGLPYTQCQNGVSRLRMRGLVCEDGGVQKHYTRQRKYWRAKP